MYVYNPCARSISLYAEGAASDAKFAQRGRRIRFIAPGETIEVPEQYREQVRANIAKPSMKDRTGQPMLREIADPSLAQFIPDAQPDHIPPLTAGVVIDGQRELGVFDRGGKVAPKKK